MPSSSRAVGGKRRVFFNPAASVNRDVSVAMAEAVGAETFCDSMAGVGARGVRIANEVEGVERVTLVDLGREALRLAKRSAALNGVLSKCDFRCAETNATLFSEFQGKRREDVVDLDPFGSPIRHLQAVMSATADRGTVSVTATDTAVLCGVHQQVCRRRYGATPLNNSFHHETAIRILVNAIRRIASSLELGIAPVGAHSTRHYLRVFARIEVGASRADSNLRNEGYVLSCASCRHMEASSIPVLHCRKCAKKNKVAGPLWMGDLSDPGVLERASRKAEKEGMKEAAMLLESLLPVNSFPPWSYSIAEACSFLKKATVPERLVVEALSRQGFCSARQPFEETGLKSDAPYSEFLDAVRRAGSSP